MSLQNCLDKMRKTLVAIDDTEYLKKQAEVEKEQEDERIRIQLKEWRDNGVTPRYDLATWENWIADTPEKILALETAKQAWNKNLFFTGNNGTGKTHLAMCLAKDGAIYTRLPDIFRNVRVNFDREKGILDCCGNVKLLVIDEIGRQKYSDFEMNFFFEIIDRRWNNNLNTTIITNLSAQEFAEFYGLAIIDRLRPVEVKFEWESWRQNI